MVLRIRLLTTALPMRVLSAHSALLPSLPALGTPKLQILTEQLHRYVGIAVFDNRASLHRCLPGIIQSARRGLYRILGVLQYLVLEDRKVQSEAKAHGVREVHGTGLAHRVVIRRSRFFGEAGLLLALAELRKVTVIVALHFQVKCFVFSSSCGWEERCVQNAQKAVADFLEFSLHPRFVTHRKAVVVMVRLPLRLRDAQSMTHCLTAFRQCVFESRRKHVALVSGERHACHDSLFHEVHHVVVAPRALRNTRKGDRLVLAHICKKVALSNDANVD
mmetsp:Transcript_29947/g.82202  ORF Transcript_29947/g.82202 Transcript_29947/m.82202 type:complete len:276 (-) Transcript_29947:45-872(-)